MMSIQFLLTFSVLLIVFLSSELVQAKTKRTFRWVTGKTALNYVTQELSSMEEFKKNILEPFKVVRVSGTQENRNVQEHIKTVLKNLGWTVEQDRFIDTTPYGDKEFTNIIATQDPKKPKQVVLACHFDSKYFKKGKFLAATDSAVPCAIMLETARQLQCLLDKGPKDKSSANELSLQLIFFDGEEAFKDWTATDSLYGARHLAQRWADESESDDNVKKINKIREFILLDLIGTTDTQFRSQFEATGNLYNQLVKTEKLLRSQGYLNKGHTKTIFNDMHGYGHIEDDHKPFLDRGVDVLHLISTPFPKVWHKMSDNWENLDFDLIDNFSRIFRVFISNLLHLQPEYNGCRKK